VSTDSATDGGGARTVRVFYLDENKNAFDANDDFLSVDVSMNGTAAVLTGVTATRVWRVKVLTVGSSTFNDGTITVRHTTTTANIFAQVQPGIGQSEFAGFTIPSGHSGFLLSYDTVLLDSNTNRGTMVIWRREEGRSEILTRKYFVLNTQPDDRTIYGGVKFVEKEDFVFRATSVTSNDTAISVRFTMLITKNP